MAAPPVASPCTGVCVIGNDGLCDGCLRTLAEITDWGDADDAERSAILRNLAQRRVRRTTHPRS